MNLISLTEIANQCTRRTPPTWTHEYAMTRITQLVQAEVEAMRIETLEKAAKVCEEYHSPGSVVYVTDVANAIRSMK